MTYARPDACGPVGRVALSWAGLSWAVSAGVTIRVPGGASSASRARSGSSVRITVVRESSIM